MEAALGINSDCAPLRHRRPLSPTLSRMSVIFTALLRLRSRYILTYGAREVPGIVRQHDSGGRLLHATLVEAQPCNVEAAVQTGRGSSHITNSLVHEKV